MTSGLDSPRVAMMLAVLQRRCGVKLHDRDVYAATVGGVRLSEPSVDLAVALAVTGAAGDLALPSDLVAFGEVGLAGEVRGVQAAKRRLSEAARLGYRRAIVPAGSLDPAVQTTGTFVTDEGMQVVEADAVWSAIDMAFASRGPGA
jgi:DNA repair protein RadA/Sms